MKKLYILFLLSLISCSDSKYKHIGQEIIDGKVSAIKSGIKSSGRGSLEELPKIWVQSATETREVDIPFEYEGRWKVGDSCLLIIEKYEIIKEK
jgi:hypothetical protein